MNKSRKTSNLYNIVTYDDSGNVVLPASLTLGTSPASNDNSSKVATTSWIASYISSLSLATSSSVTTAIANLVAAAPTTLDTLNELATALGNDPNFATTIATSIGGKLSLTGGTLTGDLTLSGTNPRIYLTDTDNNPDYFISNTDGTFTVYDVTNSVGRFKIYTTGSAEFSNQLTAASFVRLNGLATQFLKADGSIDSSTYLTGITSAQVTTALGFTPYNATNPSGYLTVSTVLNTVLTPYAVGTNTAVAATDTIETAIEKLQGQVNARQASLSGTGFVKSTAGVISYDTNTYALSTHTHTYFIGTTAVQTSSANQALSGITGITFVAEASDAASITTTISSTSTFFDFNLADDNNNDEWRWRFTPSGATVYNAMRLVPVSNTASNLIVSGTITGSQIIRSGGTAAQFLKADGSVDSATYLTSYTETSTLANVTARGASTSTAITLNAELTIQTNTSTGIRMNSSTGTQGLWIRTGYDSDGTATPAVSATNVVFQSSGSSSGTFSFVSGNTKVLSIGGTINSLVALQQSGNQVWHAGNLTNLNQLTNGPGYITGYTETDTLATVTGRGASTSTAITLNNNLLFGNSGTTKRGIQGTVGDNDYWFIGGGATASNAGFLEISTGDDGQGASSAEPIYVRQYGPGDPLTGTLVRTAALLDASGNTSFPGAVTFPGGTISGTLTVQGGGNNGVTIGLNARDVTAARSATTGVIYLGSDGNHYVYFDGSNYQMPSGNLFVNGSQAVLNTGTWSINVTGYAMSLNGYANQTEYTILNGPANGPVIKVRYDSATANRYIDFGSKDGNGVYYEGLKIYNGSTPTWGGNTILHAGNYNSYSPTLTGGNASGTWGINVTGYSTSVELTGGNYIWFNGSGYHNVRMYESYGVTINCISTPWNFQVLNGSIISGFQPSGGNYGSGNIYATGDVTAYYSDKRLKHELKPIESALEKIKLLTGYTYKHNKLGQQLLNENAYKVHVGFVAQEVQKVLPEIVTIAPFDLDGYDEYGNGISKSGNDYLTIKYERIAPLLVEAIKEQQKQIEELKSIINDITK